MPTVRPKPLDAQPDLYENGIGKFNEYRLEPGVCILPLAQEPPTNQSELADWSPVVELHLHAPYRVRRVRYISDKVNNPPVLPSPTSQGAFIFTGGTLSIVTALNTSLANFNWTVDADYEFVENCVSRIQDGFVLGSYQVPMAMAKENARDLGLNLFSPPGQSASTGGIGAVAQAGLDARTGYLMGEQINFYASWGYNQDAFLPGTLFNDRIVNGDLSIQNTQQ